MSVASTDEFPLDEWIATVKQCKLLQESDFKKLCELVKSYLLEESNVQPVSTPVTICGDIHGQFFDLLELFKTGGEISEGCSSDTSTSTNSDSTTEANDGLSNNNSNYIFMGDFVDRGYHSVETITYLLLLKARYPSRITLLRGNHESRQITQVYGFYDEVQQKYGNANVWKYCCNLFDYLTIAAVIDGSYMCVHGGLSPEIQSLDQIRSTIQRNVEIPHEGPFCDMMWSDPEEIEGWQVSPRGAGWMFGHGPVTHFNHNNNLQLICRSHQLVNEGYKYQFEQQLVTVWSAPNYCYRCGNIASVLHIDENGEREFKLFKEVEASSRIVPARNTSSYFL